MRALVRALVAMADAARAREAVRECHRPHSSAQAKQEAHRVLEAAKETDVGRGWAMGMELAAHEEDLEVRHFAYGLLMHMVKHKYKSADWNTRERIQQNSKTALAQVGNQTDQPYAIKSKCAQLVAEVAKQDVDAWTGLLGPLFEYAQCGPTQAECVSMVFQRLPEEVVDGSDDLHAFEKRELLATLTASLPDVLQLLYRIVEGNFSQAVQRIQHGDQEAGRLHAAAVNAGLRALLAYASWAPVSMLAKHGILEACSFFLTTSEFQVPACTILKEASSRKCAPAEAKEDHAEAIRKLFQVSCLACGQNLTESSRADDEYIAILCDAIATLGASHFGLLVEPESRASFLQQLLAVARHPSFSLSNVSLPAWNAILREARANATVCGMVPEGCPEALIELAGAKLSAKLDEDSLPTEFDSLEEFKEFFSVYKSRLLELIKHCSALKPQAAAQACAMRVAKIQRDIEEGNVALESLVGDWDAVASFLESVCSAVPEEVLRPMSIESMAVSFDCILDQLLGLQVADATLIAQVSCRHCVAVASLVFHMTNM